jgi:hypothetical protein
VAGIASVKGEYTLTVDTALAIGETLTIANVATGLVPYTPKATEDTEEEQAIAIANAIKKATAGAKYDTTVNGTEITLTQKNPGDTSDWLPPAVEALANHGSVSSVTNPTIGKDAVAAVYTFTVNEAFVNKRLTITNVATSNVTYTPSTGETTPELQAAAIASAITNANNVKYTANAATGSAIVTLTLKTPGAVSTRPATTTTNLDPTSVPVEISTTPGTGDSTSGTEAVHTFTIAPALTTGQTLTITNIATDPVTYNYDSTKTKLIRQQR